MKAWRKLSLRMKLTVLYVTLLICSLGVVGIYSYWSVWQLLVQSKMSHLRALAKPVIEHWLQDQRYDNSVLDKIPLTPQNTASLARDLTSRHVVALVLDRDGKILSNGRRLPEEPMAPIPQAQYYRKALAGQNEISYRAEANEKPIMVLLIPVRLKPGSSHILGVIQLSSQISTITRILFQHGLMLIAIVAITLITGIAAAFLMTGHSLNSLKDLAVTCRQISAGDFSRRVQVGDQKDEVGQLADSFNLMIQRLEAIFDSQQRFVANAAHEILTPLTGLYGSLEVLLRGAQDDPSAAAKLSRGMYREVNRLIRLCERLLSLTRLEVSPNLRKEYTSLHDFFVNFIEQGKSMAGERRIKLSEGPYIIAMVDRDMLKQILLNLLSNSMRHSQLGTDIELGWKQIPGYVEIWFSDHGEGIDEKTLPHIFEPFYQGRSDLQNGEKGAGLGLTLVKAMVEAHGGSIRVVSSAKGTTVFFTLPLE